jgi:hypothetical protein
MKAPTAVSRFKKFRRAAAILLLALAALAAYLLRGGFRHFETTALSGSSRRTY